MPPPRVDRPPRDRDGRARHRRERDAYRFVELVPGTRLAVCDGLATASGALLAGAVAGFLLLLGAALVGAEVLPSWEHEADEAVRTTIGWWVLTLLVAVLAVVPLRAATTLAVASALTAADRPRTDVPPLPLRRRVAGSNPPGAVAGLAWTVLAVAVVAGGVVAPLAMGPGDAERAPTVVVSAVVGAAAVVGLVALRALRSRWTAARDAVRSTWGPNEVRAAEAAERRRRAALPRTAPAAEARREVRSGSSVRRRDRVTTALGVAGGVGFVLFLVGVTMRHPRRRGPDAHYGPVGETAIDVLVGTGGALLGAALLAGALWFVLPNRRRARQRREALARLRSPDPGPPPVDDVVQELLSPWSGGAAVAIGVLAVTGLVAPSVLAGVRGDGVALVAPGVPYGPVGVVLLVAAVAAAAVLVDDVGRSARRRARVRARWHVDDATG